MRLWYQLLNCGFRIHATAGTDCFLNNLGSPPPGIHRVYVHHDGPLNYTDWIDGLKAGKSFVTNGPMLTFTVNGSPPGRVLKAVRKSKIRVKAVARMQFPLKKPHLINNGKVIAKAKPADDQLSCDLGAGSRP